MTKRTLTLALGIAGAVMISGAAAAADHEVRMVNRGDDGQIMAFEPALLSVAPGDTITFIATDAGHNAEIIGGMMPDGAESWKGGINEEIVVTLNEDGVYGYKCLPHYAMGMVGVIVVGDSLENVAAAAEVAHPGRAAERMAALLEQAEAEHAAEIGDLALGQ